MTERLWELLNSQRTLPSRVNIMGHEYTVTREPDGDEPENAVGWAEADTQRIWVKKGIHHQEALETLMHEILEVVNAEMDLGLPHTTINTLANALYTIRT